MLHPIVNPPIPDPTKLPDGELITLFEMEKDADVERSMLEPGYVNERNWTCEEAVTMLPRTRNHELFDRYGCDVAEMK